MEIIRGKQVKARRVVIYGPEGVGKSTFASQFPNPLFIDIEESTVNLDVARTPTPSSWGMLLSLLSDIKRNPMGFQTVVIDTADWAQKLAATELCARYKIDGIEGMGYGKGYTYLAEEFGKLLDACSELVDAGIHVVITAHAATRKFELPEEEGAFDRWEMKLEKKVASLPKEWADMVLFATYRTYVAVDDKTRKAKASGGTVRVIKTEHAAAYDAKNRDGLPPELPMDFSKIAHCFTFTRTQDTTQPNAPTDTTPPPTNSTPSTPRFPAAYPPKESTQPTQTVAPPATKATNGAHKKLVDMMAMSGVTYEQVLGVIVSKGHYPAGTPIENLDPKFIEGFCVPHWDKITKSINNKQGVSA